MQHEFVASIKRSVQISPDDWEIETKTMALTETTTVGEIVSWLFVMGFNIERHIPNITITILEKNRQ